ncbi:hypothetical protein [Ruegeria atlantica]|uniref:hypothetical protein n=1 Tax=Ruegeria atlantica TaxID=81569 RepID=UPI00147D6FD2|nr:hypothetical protein [Ruegeria atlantica]
MIPLPTADDWQNAIGILGVLAVIGAGGIILRQLGFLGGKAAASAPAPAPNASPAQPPAPAMHADITERFDRHAERITRLETAVSGLASRADIHRIEIAIQTQEGAIREIRAFMASDAKAVARLDASITRIEDHLLGEERS